MTMPNYLLPLALVVMVGLLLYSLIPIVWGEISE